MKSISHTALRTWANRPGIASVAFVQYSTRSSSKPHPLKTHSRPPSGQPASPTVPSTSSTATTSLANDVNPPPSTRPADLNLPDAVAPSAGPAAKLKRYVALGRAYLSFYKTGVKNVYHNYRAAIPLRRALGLPVYLPTSPPPSSPSSTFHKTVLSLSRANLQLVRRAAHDLRRLIPFALILILCGEMTPLAVLVLGNAVTPFTCRVPRQIEKDRTQRVARQRAALAAHTGSVAVDEDAERNLLAVFASTDWVETADSSAILRACAALNLVRSHSRPPLLVPFLYRPRLRRYVEYLALDDRLIRAGGGVKALEAGEVRIAVDERGGVAVARGMGGWDAEREERRWLERWLERT